MRSVSYYRKSGDVNECSFSRIPPIIVNCAGVFNTDAPFETLNLEGRHDRYLMYIVTGSLEFISLKVTLTEGQYVLIPPETPYRYKHTGGEEIKYLWVHFTGGDSGALPEYLGIKENTAVTVGVDEKLILTHSALLRELSALDEHFDVGCAGCLYEYLTRLGRLTSRQSDPIANASKAIKRSVVYIRENFHKHITVSELSKRANLSESRFRVLFKEATGMSPIDYLTEFRIDQACRILTESDISIIRVSLLTGFEDPLYFSRVFKKRMGVSPKEYRSASKSQQ